MLTTEFNMEMALKVAAEEAFEEGFEKGREEIREEVKKEAIIKMLKRNYPDDDIITITGINSDKLTQYKTALLGV